MGGAQSYERRRREDSTRSSFFDFETWKCFLDGYVI